MATNHYILNITSKGADASYKVTYRNGKFFRLEAKRQKLSETQRNNLMMLVPDKEENISNIKFNGVVFVPEQKAGTKSLFSRFLDVYTNWYYLHTDINHRMNGIEGNSLKSIIKHLQNISVSDEEALVLWNQILSNWDKLNDFYKSQMELRQINSNINIILRQLKDDGNSKSKASNYADELRRNI